MIVYVTFSEKNENHYNFTKRNNRHGKKLNVHNVGPKDYAMTWN